MVGTANDKKSAPLSTSKSGDGLSSRPEQPARDRQMFAPAAVSTRNVLGERQTALDMASRYAGNAATLVQHFKVTKHLRHFCVL